MNIAKASKRKFVTKHRNLIREIVTSRERMPLSEKVITDLARKELGYASATVDCDIFRSVRNSYLKI
jgi:hypothetical protein